jgi:hypothetical protein
MNTSDPKAELLELCDRLIDGQFTEQDRDRIETLVLANLELRKIYVEVMHLNASLRQEASRISDRSLEEVLLPFSMPEASRRPWRMPRWPFQIAAALVIGFVVWWFVPRPETAPIARLVETNGARWENSSLPTNPGAALDHGRLRLIEGVARIVFQKGAEVSLEGPAELELTGPNACFLHRGALVAHVPEPAKGFIVGTRNAQLIDHGTDFGISTDAAGRAQVQVLKGEVELQHGQTGEKLRLQTRESASIVSNRFTSGERMEIEPDRFAFARPTAAERQATVTLTTAGGSGDAAYVVSPNSPIHFSDTLVLIKNAPTKSYLRKGFVRFDLAPLRNRKVTDAMLSLNFEATGFGYASLTGECTFAVYGLTDAAQDDWSNGNLTWETAPAFDADGGKVDVNKATKLGTFVTPKGVVSGTFSIQGPELAQFVNADENRKATLIVVRETCEMGNNSAVHGFAGNHHPTLAPPTLRLTVAAGE